MNPTNTFIAPVASQLEAFASNAPLLLMLLAVIVMFAAGSIVSSLLRSMLAAVGLILAPLLASLRAFGFALLLLVGAMAVGLLDQLTGR